jgi:4-amino-4-deoxy-L-arabinose transferase-like glycosyltransferase
MLGFTSRISKTSMRGYELPAVLALATALRLLLVVLWTPELSGDALDYDRLARSLMDGRGYTNSRGELTSWRPPLYPAFVAAGYILSGGSVRGVRLFQALLDVGTVALTYHLGKRFFGYAAGCIAGLLVAVNFGTVAATSRLLSESVFTVLLMAAVVLSAAWLQAMNDKRVQAAVGLGISGGALVGAGTLCRGVLLLYPFCLVSMTVLCAHIFPSPSGSTLPVSERRQGILWACVALLLGFILVLIPWTFRNYQVHGAFVPVTTQIGVALYSAYNPPDGWRFGVDAQDENTAVAGRLPEVEASAMLSKAAVDSIVSSPRRTLRLEVLKAVYFWVPIDWEILPFYGAFNLTYAFVGLWALVYMGLRAKREEDLPTWPAWLPVLYVFGMAMVVQGSPRYRLPVEPLLAVFAAAALVTLYRDAGRRTFTVLLTGTVGGLLLVYVLAVPLRNIAKSWITGAE